LFLAIAFGLGSCKGARGGSFEVSSPGGGVRQREYYAYCKEVGRHGRPPDCVLEFEVVTSAFTGIEPGMRFSAPTKAPVREYGVFAGDFVAGSNVVRVSFAKKGGRFVAVPGGWIEDVLELRKVGLEEQD
jgi:hypothetical protein